MAEKTHRTDYEKYIRELAEFMDVNGCKLRPFPKYRISNEKQNPLLGKTAYYDPETKTVTCYVNNRLLKDVMRSISHENVHHHQNLEGRLTGYNGDTLGQDSKLDELESEAYLTGNILFRKWTETKRKSEKPEKTFTKHMKKKIAINESNDVFSFGKYKGYRISEIIFKNPEYCLWLYKNLDNNPFTEKQTALLDSVYFQKYAVFPIKSRLTPKYIKLNGKPVSQMDSDELQTVYNNEDNELKWLVRQEHKNRGWVKAKGGFLKGASAFQSDDVGDEAWKLNEQEIKDALHEIINEMLQKQ